MVRALMFSLAILLYGCGAPENSAADNQASEQNSASMAPLSDRSFIFDGQVVDLDKDGFSVDTGTIDAFLAPGRSAKDVKLVLGPPANIGSGTGNEVAYIYNYTLENGTQRRLIVLFEPDLADEAASNAEFMQNGGKYTSYLKVKKYLYLNEGWLTPFSK